MAKIKKIVDEEDNSRPLSDNKIVGILRGDGMTIARRTVVKYREELGILASPDRKKAFLVSRK
jgi:RNA polymerase sigma-54 factor